MGQMRLDWKSMTDDPVTGEEAGKVFIYDEDDPDVDPLDEWMTRSDAQKLAREKGYPFEEI